ncbi:hypothetical protein ACT0HV_000576 [Vibrio diabolicus]
MLDDDIDYLVKDICNGNHLEALHYLAEIKLEHEKILRDIYINKTETLEFGVHKLRGSCRLLGLNSLSSYYSFMNIISEVHLIFHQVDKMFDLYCTDLRQKLNDT